MNSRARFGFHCFIQNWEQQCAQGIEAYSCQQEYQESDFAPGDQDLEGLQRSRL
jgi:hypothetical protein